jgi:hypothetical protein
MESFALPHPVLSHFSGLSLIQVSGFKGGQEQMLQYYQKQCLINYDISDLVWKGEKGKIEEQGKIQIFGQIGFICSRSFGWHRAESKGALPFTPNFLGYFLELHGSRFLLRLAR